MRFGVGSKVHVQVSRVDLDARKIDFRLVVPAETDRLLAKGRRTTSAAAAAAPGSAREELATLQHADREAKSSGRRLRAQASRSGAAAKAARVGAKRGSKAAGKKTGRR